MVEETYKEKWKWWKRTSPGKSLEREWPMPMCRTTFENLLDFLIWEQHKKWLRRGGRFVSNKLFGDLLFTCTAKYYIWLIWNSLQRKSILRGILAVSYYEFIGRSFSSGNVSIQKLHWLGLFFCSSSNSTECAMRL